MQGACALLWLVTAVHAAFHLLDPAAYETYLYGDFEWATSNIPFFEASLDDLTAAYFFRWHTYRQHIVHYPDSVGYVVTEFLPNVSWAGPYNTISAAAGHHIYEGRWLRDPAVVDNYTAFWLGEGFPHARGYTFWLADAVWSRYKVTGDPELPLQWLPRLQDYFDAVHSDHWVSQQQCYFQGDNFDGAEVSISGDGCRPTINAMMYGERRAIASLHALSGNQVAAAESLTAATKLQRHVLDILWSQDVQFLSVLAVAEPRFPPVNWCNGTQPAWPAGTLAPVRELFALSCPYYFGLIPQQDTSLNQRYHAMWDQVFDPEGFQSMWGPRVTERRHELYNYSCHHECLWNAPTWPYETSRLLTGLANLLNDYPANVSSMTKQSFWQLLLQFVQAHMQSTTAFPFNSDGNAVPEHPWIGEDLHPDWGYWVARDKMHRWNMTGPNRGYKYNHSTFNDLIITGLVGLRPRPDGLLIVNPLLPSDTLTHFAIDNLLYHGHELTIFWDSDGTHYRKGQGLHVWVDAQERAHAAGLERLTLFLPSIAL